MKKSVLVTGCAGFIGSNFCNQFIKKYPEIDIVGVDDLSSGRKSEINKKIIFYKASITDEKKIDKIFAKHKPDFIFHFAAIPRVSFSVENPSKTTLANVYGAVVVLEKAVKYGCKRFILSSSSSVYGGAKKMPTKESENFPDPKSPYAGQKYSDEIFCKIFANLFDIDTVCLRYFNVYGPLQYGDSAYSTVISAWLESIYFPNNKKAFIEGNGKQSRDFCYVDNVVSANMLAMESKSKLNGEVFNIAHGERVSVNTVKKLIEKYTNKKILLEKRPPRKGDVLHTYADISRAEKILKYKPKVKFEEGLIKTIEWFENRKK